MYLHKLECCSQSFPIQIDVESPWFSWQIVSEGETGIRQSAYRIVVQDEQGKEMWDSGQVDSAETLQVIYRGKSLKSDTRYRWRVSTWIGKDKGIVLYNESWFETGLKKRWAAKWIGYDVLPKNMKPFDKEKPFYCADDFNLGRNEYYLPPAPYLRKEFSVVKPVKKAKIFLSALGMVDIRINGKRITEERFLPGTADYDHMVWSKCYDVTGIIEDGMNAIGVILADGWYSGYVGLHNRQWYGNHPRAIIQLVLSDGDGHKTNVITDESWKACYGAVQEADIFQGECFDATKEIKGYSEAGFDDSKWAPVTIGGEKETMPEAHPGVPMIVHEQLAAKEVIPQKNGQILVDFGRVISGVLRVTVKAARNVKIQIRHAEILDSDGNLFLDGNRSARAMDTYICSGEGVEVFEPRFTYHGFRYATIGGVKNDEILNIEGLSIGSAFFERTKFNASNKTLNEVYQICRDSMLCNMMDNPTDVCARDERLGWGLEGDHAVSSAAMLGNMEAFIRKWTRDIWSSQHEDGSLEPIAPPMMMKDVEQFSGDLQTNHGIRMIYILYKLYGDKEVVREYYPALQKFFAFLEQNSDRHIRFGTTGDWLNIWESTNHSDINHGYGDSIPGIVGTSHYANIIHMMIEMSEGIGKEAGDYYILLEKVKKVFAQNFIQRDGTLRFGKQGDYVLALATGLIPVQYRNKASTELQRKLTENGRVFWRGGTASTPYFLPVLKKYGLVEEANDFLTSRDYPSIGYMVDNGPGTVWERWDGIWENGNLHPQSMNAMCHIGLTVVDEYLVTGLGGIRPLEPGYHRFEIVPAPSEKVREVDITYYSKSGAIKVWWMSEGDRFWIRFTVPANTKAYIRIPCRRPESLYVRKGSVENITYENYTCSFEVNSGEYSAETGI